VVNIEAIFERFIFAYTTTIEVIASVIAHEEPRIMLRCERRGRVS
jgi:hypothetical protein